ncbi:MAG: hypothetical protein KAT17_02050 [Candidatus Aminicenantes bacterium]|nr:hypothetical protein [Candidatus Aminicenantes bacterium]
MKDIKDILAYLGLSFKSFLTQLFFHFLSLFLVVVLIFSIFLFYYKLLTRTAVIFLLFFFILILHHVLKSSFLIKQQWILNTGFAFFLKYQGMLPQPTGQENDSINRLSSGQIRSWLKSTHDDFVEKGVRVFSKKLLWSVSTLKRTVCYDFILDKETGKKMQQITMKYFFIKVLIFLMLLIPFVMISVLFTIGLQIELKFIFVLLGFCFVYFLNAAIFEPIFYLLVQRKIFNLISQSSGGI